MVAARKIGEIPELGPVLVERGTILYKCTLCDFSTANPEEATDHDFEENKKKRYDSQWRHTIEITTSRDSTAPCPLCNTPTHNSPDLKSHLIKEHGKTPDRLVDMIFSLEDQNTRLIGVSRSLVATLRSMSKGRFQVRRNKHSRSSNVPGLDDEDLEEG